MHIPHATPGSPHPHPNTEPTEPDAEIRDPRPRLPTTGHRAVLRAVPPLPPTDVTTPEASDQDQDPSTDPSLRPGQAPSPLLPLLREALRSGDPDLMAAVLGPCAATHLPDDEYRRAVVDCARHGVPLDHIASLAERADAQLALMLVDFAYELVATGQDVPEDVWPVVRAFPGPATARLAAETQSPVARRRRAAARALAAFATARPLRTAARSSAVPPVRPAHPTGA